MSPEWLLLIATWCTSSPHPYKNVIECREQLFKCVQMTRDTVNCFAPEETKKREVMR